MMKIGDLVFYWPLFAQEAECAVVLLERESDEDAIYEDKTPKPAWRVLLDGKYRWILERDLRSMKVVQ
jgi:hypothetical protein|tara:strand:+ start:947 stop:1150 length:204 start_codon:yes stop_codon:yes gene_type:complete